MTRYFSSARWTRWDYRMEMKLFFLHLFGYFFFRPRSTWKRFYFACCFTNGVRHRELGNSEEFMQEKKEQILGEEKSKVFFVHSQHPSPRPLSSSCSIKIRKSHKIYMLCIICTGDWVRKERSQKKKSTRIGNWDLYMVEWIFCIYRLWKIYVWWWKLISLPFRFFFRSKAFNKSYNIRLLALIQQAKPSDRPIVCLIYTSIQRYRSTRSVYKSFSDFYTISIFLLFNFPLSSPKFC